MKQLTCGFIGLGLVGGSIARALKQFIPEVRIVAFDPNPDTLVLSVKENIVDTPAACVDESFSVCDYIFLCAPVSHNDQNLLAVRPFLKKDAILTDVGSVKTTIHEHIKAAGLTHCFIGGHPMTGSERTGFANSKASLLENAYYILTPSDDVPSEAVDEMTELVKALGAIPLLLDYKQHDYITAAVSHLPHVIASSLVKLVKESDGKDGLMKMIAAGGFKDITRIASSSPVMWQQICLTNTENISGLLEHYIESLQKIKQEIDSHNPVALYDFFESARDYRDSFIEAGSGPIKKVYAIQIDIPDEPGSLAAVATLLALNGINIKNIGIVHNREVEEGVLRVEFYEEDSIEKAIRLLTGRGYTSHLRK